jgi:hypothetical protein
MPAQERVGADKEDRPTGPRKQPAEAREQSPICARELRAGYLTLEDRQLVAENDELDLLRPL